MNDPSKWEVSSLEFISPEEAKKAEELIERILAESYEQGRLDGIEEAAKLCEGNHLLSGSIGPLYSAGWEEAIKFTAEVIRRLLGEKGESK